MPYFATGLHLKYIDGASWELDADLVYVRDADAYTAYTIKRLREGGPQWPDDLRIAIVVPKGFVFDFASVPRFFWRVLPPVGHGKRGAYGAASCLHDWLYRSGAVSRKDADLLFRESMGVLGVSSWRKWLMWSAVRLFGWAAYQG